MSNGVAGSTEEPDSSKKPKGKPDHVRHWEFLQVGDWIRWYEGGDTALEAYPAMITKKFKEGHALGLTVWAHNSQTPHRRTDGPRHVDDPGYVKFQREEIGAWEPTLLQKLVMDANDG